MIRSVAVGIIAFSLVLWLRGEMSDIPTAIAVFAGVATLLSLFVRNK